MKIKGILLFIVLIFGVFVAWSFLSKGKGAAVEEFSVTFNPELTRSNLYPPEIGARYAGGKIFLSWDFEEKKLVASEGNPPEYVILSGFRIYRDGFWYKDVDNLQKEFTDENIFPSDRYKYQVSALTFDNKIEGEISEAVEVEAGGGTVAKKKRKRGNKTKIVLVEGDSVAEGQRAGKGNGWADKLSGFLKSPDKSYTLVNLSVSGSFSSDVLSRMGGEIGKYDPDIVIVQVGTNDLFAASSYLGNVSLFSYLDNLKSIGEISGEGRDRAVLVINLHKIACCDEKTLVWNRAIKALSLREGFYLVDIYPISEKDGFLDDKLHPGIWGHGEIFKRVRDVLLEEIGI